MSSAAKRGGKVVVQLNPGACTPGQAQDMVLFGKHEDIVLQAMEDPEEVFAPVHGLAQTHPHGGPQVGLELARVKKDAVKPRRRDFEGIGGRNGVGHVQGEAQVFADGFALVDKDPVPLRVIHIHAHQKTPCAAGDFDAPQHEAVGLTGGLRQGCDLGKEVCCIHNSLEKKKVDRDQGPPSSVLPLHADGFMRSGAGDENRTRDTKLGKLVLYP